MSGKGSGVNRKDYTMTPLQNAILLLAPHLNLAVTKTDHGTLIDFHGVICAPSSEITELINAGQIHLGSRTKRIKVGKEVYIIYVEKHGIDSWNRPALKAKANGQIFVDTSLAQSSNRTNGLPGDWHTVTDEGEPLCPLAPHIKLITNHE